MGCSICLWQVVKLGELELESRLYHKQERFRWVLGNDGARKAGEWLRARWERERGVGGDGCPSSF